MSGKRYRTGRRFIQLVRVRGRISSLIWFARMAISIESTYEAKRLCRTNLTKLRRVEKLIDIRLEEIVAYGVVR